MRRLLAAGCFAVMANHAIAAPVSIALDDQQQRNVIFLYNTFEQCMGAVIDGSETQLCRAIPPVLQGLRDMVNNAQQVQAAAAAAAQKNAPAPAAPAPPLAPGGG